MNEIDQTMLTNTNNLRSLETKTFKKSQGHQQDIDKLKAQNKLLTELQTRMTKCEKEKASSLLFKRLEEKVQYGVPTMADFESFKDETINGMQNGNDQSKYMSKKFD